MKKLLMGMAAVSVVAIAAPASAQGYRAGYADTRVDALHARVAAGVRQGSIDRREAQSLRMQIRELGRLEQRYARDGIAPGERRDLQGRMQSLRRQIRSAEMTGGGRYDRSRSWEDRSGDRFGRECPPGLGDRDNGCIPPGQEGRDGRWEDRRDERLEDRSDGRWEDRDDRGEERWNDRREGYDPDGDRDDDRVVDGDRRLDDRDGIYRERDRRGGLNEPVDRVTGGLRVGQRVSGGLDALPGEYRDRFRDGDGIYHRTDGRNIYRIDARTDVVLQVYPLRL